MKNIPAILREKADELETKTKARFPKLAPLVKQCFLNTIETTVTQLDDGSYFVITGDIPAMWLRDSAAQVKPYIKYAAEDEQLREILRSIIAKHAFYVNLDPYSNAFNATDSGVIFGYKDHTDFENGYIWERKYEVDSLCASLYLTHEYYTATKDRKIFTDSLHGMIHTIVQTFTDQQDHAATSYFFSRENCPASDTLAHDGRGTPVNPETGMTWSGFRPSDDARQYHYLVPSNMLAFSVLRGLEKLPLSENLKKRAAELADEIAGGIRKYAVAEGPSGKGMYAYETDGLGNFNLMDDANLPSLLGAPWYGFCETDDPLYQETRKFLLSPENPYYFQGKYAAGIGSPHTPDGYIWHIGLIVQGLTASNDSEKAAILEALKNTNAGTGHMHEGFDPNDPGRFTRPWFAWADSMFCLLVEDYYHL